MIGALRSWAFTLCAAACVAALLQMLLPKGAQNTAVAMVINLFLLLCVIAPLQHFHPSAVEQATRLPQTATDPDGIPTADALIATEIETRVRTLATDKLQTLGIIPQEVRIDMVISEDTFEIIGVTVMLASPQNEGTRAAGDQLADYLGLPVTMQGTNEVT